MNKMDGMEVPKNYSNVYQEERAPVPATRSAKLSIDGAAALRRNPESGIDPHELSLKLFNLSKEQHKAYASYTLQQHYTSVFQNRSKQTYKVYITYMDGEPKERYLVRIERNALREVKAKMPIKGDYRLFFGRTQNEREEVEDDDSILPYHEKDGLQTIYCYAFRK